MKILIVNSFYYPDMPGGAEHSIKNLAETLVEKGHDVSILCTSESEKMETISGVDIYRIKNKNIKSLSEYYKSQNKSIEKLIYRSIDLHGYLNKSKILNVIDEVNPDIVHINNIPGIGLNIFNLLKQRGILTVFTARDYYSICSNSTLVNSNGEICKNKKVSCEIYEKINKKFISNVNCITAPSEFSLELMKNSIGSNKIRFECINNSIDIDRKYITEVYNYKVNKIKTKKSLDLVFLGRLEEHKGIKLLIEYFIRLGDSETRLHIAGDGKFTDYVKRLNIDNIIYYGNLNKEELDKLLKSTDILIAPSLWFEPFGRVVIDAYKYSMPVISTGNGGLKELIKNGETGYVIDFSNYSEFENTISLYKNKDNIINQMFNCKVEVEKYSNNLIVEKYENLYKDLIDRNKKI